MPGDNYSKVNSRRDIVVRNLFVFPSTRLAIRGKVLINKLKCEQAKFSIRKYPFIPLLILLIFDRAFVIHNYWESRI